MNIAGLFNPSSIAIIGVSHEPQKVGYLVANNLLEQGFKGDIYFVNPKGGTILGHTVFTDIKDIKKPIDLAVLAVPGPVALSLLDTLADLHIKQVVLFAAGFKETNAEGAEMEKKLIEKAHANNMAILGPNCIGYINTAINVNVTFLKHTSPKGNIGFVSQSGAIGSILVDYFASHRSIGFSHFVSIGNKAVVDESDVLEYLGNSEETKVIGMYLEDVKNGARFREIVQKVTAKKPVIILKSGSTTEGSQAAASHTGGMVGNDDVYSAVFKQDGAIRAENYTEFLTLLTLYSRGRLPESEHVLVLSNAGGVGVLLADDLVHHSLKLATISEETKAKLVSSFGPTSKVSLHNPIDVLGDASAFDYKKVIDATIKEREIGSIIVLLTPQANTEIDKTAEIIATIQEQVSKPIYPVFMGEKSVQDMWHHFEEKQIAGFTAYDMLPQALQKTLLPRIIQTERANSAYLHNLNMIAAEPDIRTYIKNSKSKSMNVIDSLKVLEYAGVPVVHPTIIEGEQSLKSISDNLGFPLVMKISSDTISHKTEVKGVATDIKSIEELSEAYKQMHTAVSTYQDTYITAQPMKKGYELLVGAKRDPNFGIVIVLALGGIYTELLKEVSYHLYPFSMDECKRMISETKIATLAKGFRGSPPFDLDKIYHVCMGVGSLLQRFNEIQEIDINPLIVSGNELFAVDGRTILNTL